jgi:hypothetical protein
MYVHTVSYDLNNPGQSYAALIARLQQLRAVRILYSQWMLRSSMTPEQLRDDLLGYMDANDGIMVIDVSNAPMAWSRLQSEIKTAFNLT